MTEAAAPAYQIEIAALSDAGPQRDHNEDHCGHLLVSPTSAVIAVADGVSGAQAGEVASQTAVEVVLRHYFEQPPQVAPTKRLYRAVQQANIEIYDRAVVVPELRGMSTTLTAIVVAEGELMAAHVGDCRLYRVRQRDITLLTKDHTVTGERVRRGLLSEARARTHPDRSTLTRSLGRELIASIDSLVAPLAQGDVVILCSDGLYNVIDDEALVEIVHGRDAAAACRALVDAASARNSADNVTAAVVRMIGPIPTPTHAPGLAARLRRLFTLMPPGGTPFA